MNNPPLFIVGAPRSGTTLLQYMLRSHPDISGATGESHFFVPVLQGKISAEPIDSVDSTRRFLEALERRWTEFLHTDLYGIEFDARRLSERIYERGIRTQIGVVGELFSINAEGEGKSRWMDKTPYYVRHIDLLAKEFPGSQFVHIVRDGRDVALSMLERRKDFGVYNAREAARQWEWYVLAGSKSGEKLGGDRYLEIRYEDLIREPRDVVRVVCNFLKVDYSDDVINFEKATDVNGKTPLLKGNINGANMEKWRLKMSRSEVRSFESTAGEVLSRYGYDVSNPGYKLGVLQESMYFIHQRFCRWRHG